MEVQIDLGVGFALRGFLVTLAAGVVLAVVLQRLCADPRARRRQFRGRAYPRLGWLMAILLMVLTGVVAFPMYLPRFHGVRVSADTLVLQYPLGKEVRLSTAEIAHTGTRHFREPRLPWYGDFAYIELNGGSAYRSVVSPTARQSWEKVRRLGAF